MMFSMETNMPINYYDNPSREKVQELLEYLSADFQSKNHDSFSNLYTLIEKVSILGNSDSLIHEYYFADDKTTKKTLFDKEECLEGEYYPLHSLAVTSFGGDTFNGISCDEIKSIVEGVIASSTTEAKNLVISTQNFPGVEEKNFYIYDVLLSNCKAFELVYYPTKGYVVILAPIIFGNLTKSVLSDFFEKVSTTIKEKALN